MCIITGISWWRRQMETCSAFLARCAGNSPVTGEFPSQRPVTRSFDVSFHVFWVNNHRAGDLRGHRAHYDVIVMILNICDTAGHCHDDVMTWKRFRHHWPLAREIHPSPVDSPHKFLYWYTYLVTSLLGCSKMPLFGLILSFISSYNVCEIVTCVI